MTDPASFPDSRLVLLDSEPLGLLVKDPERTRDLNAARCVEWVFSLVEKGYVVTVPEIIRYELRRELILQGFEVSIKRLDRFCSSLSMLPIDEGVLDRASQLWADVRRRALPTADPKRIDVDAILVAQALVEAETKGWGQAIIATIDVDDLSRFPECDARLWRDII